MGPVIKAEYAHLVPYMRILACVHTGFCGCQLISFLIANHPSLGNLRTFGRWLLSVWRSLPFLRSRCGRLRKKKSEEEEGEESDHEDSSGKEAMESLSNDTDKPSGPVLRDEFDKLPVTNKLEVHLISGVSLFYLIRYPVANPAEFFIFFLIFFSPTALLCHWSAPRWFGSIRLDTIASPSTFWTSSSATRSSWEWFVPSSIAVSCWSRFFRFQKERFGCVRGLLVLLTCDICL